MCAECPAAEMQTATGTLESVDLMSEDVDGYWVDVSKQSDSKQLSYDAASKVWSKAALRNVCVVSSQKLPGIFSKVKFSSQLLSVEIFFVLLLSFVVIQAIKVLIRQACMLRGDAQMAVQSEIRSILDAVSEDNDSLCAHGHVEQMDDVEEPLSERECLESGSHPGFDFDEIFAPLCCRCGWIEATCCCPPPSLGVGSGSCKVDIERGSNGPRDGSESSWPSPPSRSRRGNKRSRPASEEAAAAISPLPTRRSARRRIAVALA
jgi:hypothetical protein